MNAPRTAASCAVIAFLLVLSGQDAQAQWRSVTGPRPPSVVSLARGGTTLFLGATQHDTGGPVYRSLDGGQTWLLTDGNASIHLFPHHDGVVYGGGFYVGLWRSLDDGVTWAQVAGGLPTNGSGVALAACGDVLFAAASGSTEPTRIYRSTDDGASWSALAGGLPEPALATDALCLGASVVVAVGPEVYRSDDGGTTWAPVGPGLPVEARVDVLAQSEGTLWAGVSGADAVSGVYRSTSGGQAWTRVGLALAPSFRFLGLSTDGDELYAVVDGDEPFDSGAAGLHRSANGGQSWARVWDGFENPAQAVLRVDGDLLLGTGAGPYRSSDQGATWTYTGTGTARIGAAPAVIVSGEAFLAGTVINGITSDVWRSTDDGASWTPAEAGLPENAHAVAFLRHEGAVFAGVFGAGRGVYRSTNDGVSWTPATAGIPGSTILHALHAHGAVLFAGAYEALYRSTDSGQTWDIVTGGLPANPDVRALASDGATVYVGTHGASVFRSDDEGLTWRAANAGLPDLDVLALAETPGGLLAGLEDAGLYRFDGAEWTPSGLPGATVHAILALDGILLAGGTTLAYSYDDGATWTSFDEGLVDLAEVVSLTANGEYLLAGTAYGLWLRPCSELPVPTAMERPEPDDGLRLGPSSPNPFHDHTTLSYHLPAPSPVALHVYDVLGRLTTTLADGSAEAGEHHFDLDGRALAPGVYVVELRAGTHAARTRITRVR